jgi:hypothetical protein
MAEERVSKLVNYAKLQWWGDQLSVTTSIGHAAVQSGDSMDSIVQRAQQGLARNPNAEAERLTAAAHEKG